MKGQKVVRWLQSGYPHFKEENGLPAWVVPDHSFVRITNELGGESIMELSQPLRFAEGIEELIDKAPDPETVPSEVWQMAIKLWPAHSQVKPVVDTCLEAAASILRQFQSGQLKVDPVVVCRGMAVFGCAPFVPGGRHITEELASILEGNANEPAGLLKRYVEAVTNADIGRVRRVDDCIAKYSQWVEWARIFLRQTRDFPYTTKPIGVTPPISAEIIGVLAEMIQGGTG
jgi:hypothetical protein